MNGTMRTQDPEEVRDWMDDYDGMPARVKDEPTRLRIQFGEKDDVEELSWKEFFDIFEKERLTMIYEQESRVEDDGRHPSEKYEFVRETREDLGEAPQTEMDDEQVLSNIEETAG